MIPIFLCEEECKHWCDGVSCPHRHDPPAVDVVVIVTRTTISDGPVEREIGDTLHTSSVDGGRRDRRPIHGEAFSGATII